VQAIDNFQNAAKFFKKRGAVSEAVRLKAMAPILRETQALEKLPMFAS
jgi:hypothetical protein